MRYLLHDEQGEPLGYVGPRTLTCLDSECLNYATPIVLPASGEPVVCGPCGSTLDEGGPVEYLPEPDVPVDDLPESDVPVDD